MNATSLLGSSLHRGRLRSDLGRRTQRLLLLCALALSIIGMHHLALSSHCPPQVTVLAGAHAGPPTATSLSAPAAEARPADDQPTDGTGHDMLLHLCLAVLCAAGGLLLLAWLSAAVGTSGVPTGAARSPPWVRHAWSLLLTSLCVMRT
jgi:hypothetical protein